jgi:hypothetical protein
VVLGRDYDQHRLFNDQIDSESGNVANGRPDESEIHLDKKPVVTVGARLAAVTLQSWVVD